jgi:hypothetical protein
VVGVTGKERNNSRSIIKWNRTRLNAFVMSWSAAVMPCRSHLVRFTTCLILSCAAISVARIVSSKGRDSHDSDISVSSAFFRPCSFSRASISSALQRWW